MKCPQAALLKWSEPHLFGLGFNWCSFNSLNALKLECGHNTVFSDRPEHFQQIPTFVPRLQGPCSSPITLRSAIRHDSRFLTVTAVISSLDHVTVTERGSSSHSFGKNEELPALHLCILDFIVLSGLQSLVRMVACGSPGQRLAIGCCLGKSGSSSPFSSKADGASPRASAGGWSPLGRNGCLLDKSLDSVTAVIS